MHAVIFLDRHSLHNDPGLLPAPALLNVAGATLFEHCLYHLVRMGVSDVWLVTGDNHQPLYQSFGEGGRWSVQLHYLNQNLSPNEHIRRLGDRLPSSFLAMRGDVYWPPETDLGQMNVPLPGLLQKANRHTDLTPFAWSETLANFKVAPLHQPKLLTDLHQYHQLALATMETEFLSPKASGRGHSQWLRTGPMASIHHRSLVSGCAWVGEHSQVHPEARLVQHVLVGRHCLIDRGAIVRNALVLDHTYVGAGTVIENAIVKGNQIYRLDHRECLSLHDDFLLASTQPITSGWLGPALASACLASLKKIPWRPFHSLITPLTEVANGRSNWFGRLDWVAGNSTWKDAYEALPRGLISPALLLRDSRDKGARPFPEASKAAQQLLEIEFFNQPSKWKQGQILMALLRHRLFLPHQRLDSINPS